MKKIIIICFVLSSIGSTLIAQTDISINPIGLFYNGSINLTADFGISEKISIEAGLGYDFHEKEIDDVDWKNSIFGINVIGKYYFEPSEGHDNWYVGPYMSFETGNKSTDTDTKISTTKLSIGGFGGYKIVLAKRLIIEIGLGFGKSIVDDYSQKVDGQPLPEFPTDDIDFLGKLSVGFRFGGE